MSRKVANKAGYQVNNSKLSITTPLKTVITFKTADNPDSLYGEDVYAFVFDEFSRAKEEAWHALRTTITYTNARGKFIGNVVGKNWASKMAQKAKKGMANFEYFKVTAYDGVAAGILKQSQIDEAREELPSRIFKMLYEAEISEVEGALWQWDLIENSRVLEAPEMARIVIPIDPSVTSDINSDETGIVPVGLGVDGHYYVLHDYSGIMSPSAWGAKVVTAYHDLKADRIIGEANNGGDMIEAIIRNIDKSVSYRKVTATRGKVLRAEPIVSLYERGLVHHVGNLNGLEDQMISWNATDGSKSPDRIDSLVWGLTELSQKPVVVDWII
jgi:phage terminase large subunit-like protein